MTCTKESPIHLEAVFKEEIESLVKQGILEDIKEHTDWVNSYVIVEKDTGNHHSPNHTVKKKLKICLDPRDLNEALEREPYHTHSAEEITAKLPSRERMEHIGYFPTSMEMCMDDHLTLTTEKTQQSSSKAKPLSNAVQHTAFHQTHRRTLFLAMQNSHQAWKVCHLSHGNSSCREKRNPHWGPN